MLQIQTGNSKAITPERVRIAQAIFQAAGFDEGVYKSADDIDAARSWVLANLQSLSTILPRHVLGDLRGLVTNNYRRTLMAFVRRLAQFLQGSVARKRIQYRKDGRNQSKYLYKISF